MSLSYTRFLLSGRTYSNAVFINDQEYLTDKTNIIPYSSQQIWKLTAYIKVGFYPPVFASGWEHFKQLM